MLNNDITLIIKEKISLLQIIGQRIKVSKKGNRYLALCPFHKEKTPSFTIDEAKGFFHCFGCGKGGDVFAFLKEYDNLSFKEALEYLATIAGVSLPSYNSKASNNETNLINNKNYYQLLELAANWFKVQLYAKENNFALGYFLNRGLSKYTLEQFQLGYAPKNKDALNNFLKKEGFSIDDMIKLGLMGESENGNYDVFRNRVIFPIKDKAGKIIAFGGRSLNNETPKYLNSKDTVLFHKKLNLYGLSEAVKNLRETKAIILVEGYMDVLALQQAGLAAVAPLGTAISKEQLQLLIKLSVPIFICLDGDEAGKKAALRTTELLLEIMDAGILPKFITMPKGEDPDSFLSKYAKKEFIKLMAEAKYLSDFLWQEVVGDSAKDNAVITPEEKSLLEKKLINYCKTIPNVSLQEEFIKYFLTKLNAGAKQSSYNKKQTSFSANYSKANKFYDNNQKAQITLVNNTISISNANKNNLLLRQYFLLAYVICCPQIYHHIEQEFAVLVFDNKGLEQLKQTLVSLLEENNDLNSENIQQELAKNGFTTILHDILNNLLIKKALQRLKEPGEFIDAFYDTYNRLLFDSLNNDITTMKNSLLEDAKYKDKAAGSKIINQIKHLQQEIKQTKLFKGKV